MPFLLVLGRLGRPRYFIFKDVVPGCRGGIPLRA